MSIGYGEPKTTDRPKCWSRDYNNEDRECKGCPWQVSCRDQVVRATMERQRVQTVQQAPMNYNQTFQLPQQFAVPQPFQPQVVQQHVPPPVPQYLAPRPFVAPTPVPMQNNQPVYQTVQYRPPAPAPVVAPTAQTQHQQAVGAMVQQDVYGRFQDPLYYALAQIPSPFRVQLHGETFFERWTKNIGLATGETVLVHLLLGLRQMVLPPKPIEENQES